MKTFKYLLLGVFIFGSILNIQAQEEAIYTKVEVMPVFPDCETESDAAAQKKCTETKLLEHVANNLVYPTIARQNHIEGLVVLSFVIDKEGKIETVKCIKDIGGGCGEESIRVIKLMNEKKMVWTPGKHDGKTVKVKYHLPVRFKLEGDAKEEKEVNEDAAEEEQEIEEEEEEFEEIFTVVEKMPIFPSCETAGDEQAKKVCTDKALLKYIYQNIKYPKAARENGIEGLIVVSFVVNEEGKIQDVKCIRDIGGGCGEESVRVIASMNEKNMVWTPGTQRGKAIKVKYNMPIRFRLPGKLRKEESKKRKWWQRKRN